MSSRNKPIVHQVRFKKGEGKDLEKSKKIVLET
jgi:hypothetical protein